VKIRRDRKEIGGISVCGISVRANLTFKRYLTVQDHTCIYFSARRVLGGAPCGSISIPSDEFITCGWCEVNNVKVGSFSSPNVSGAPFPSPPAGCDPLTDGEWDDPDPEDIPPWDGFPYNFLYDNDRQLETFCIVREKFIPGATDIGCNASFTVTLTADDTISDEEPNFPEPNTWPCCGKSEISQWYGYSYCQATHADPYVCGEYICPINPSPVVACPSYSGFGFFQGRNLDCLGEFGSNWTVDLAGLISSTGSAQQYCNSSFDPLLGGSITVDRCAFACATSRNRGYTLDYDIVNQTLLFGEALDSWQLTLECPD
jgi:hypothetical protein